jgi:glycosyltransferase involved in cell wall biosynthesis
MKVLRTEEEIVANWKGDLDKPVVSISCITFNHEPYIEDTLKGFLTQETDFPFEILVHDDASTDKTADIIREYESKYPRLIKPIYQIKNQYSKNTNISISGKFNIPRSKGKYLMFCEGDDYWITTIKISNQLSAAFEFDVDLVFHSVIFKTGDEEVKRNCYGLESRYVSFKEHFRKGPACAPLSSIMIKKELLYLVEQKIPGFIENNLSHASIQYVGFFRKNAYYSSEVQSVYRVSTPGSWTERIKKDDALAVSSTNRHLNTLRLIRDKLFTSHRLMITSRILVIIISSRFAPIKKINTILTLFKK